MFTYRRHGNRAAVCGRAGDFHRRRRAVRLQRQAATAYDVIACRGVSASGRDGVSVRRRGPTGEVRRMSAAPAVDGHRRLS